MNKENFKVNDLILVETQPKNMYVNVMGSIGFIEEIREDNAQIVALKPDGSTSGSGWVPLSSLKLMNHEPDVIRAKNLHDIYMSKIYKENIDWSNRYNKVKQQMVSKAAKMFKISKLEVEEIIKMYELVERDFRY